MDSNHRSRQATDLQSVCFNHSHNYPKNAEGRGLEPRLTESKSADLPLIYPSRISCFPPAGGNYSTSSAENPQHHHACLPSASQHREIVVQPTSVRLDGRFLWASLTRLRCRSEVLPNHPHLSRCFLSSGSDQPLTMARQTADTYTEAQRCRAMPDRANNGGDGENRTLNYGLQSHSYPI